MFREQNRAFTDQITQMRAQQQLEHQQLVDTLGGRVTSLEAGLHDVTSRLDAISEQVSCAASCMQRVSDLERAVIEMRSNTADLRESIRAELLQELKEATRNSSKQVGVAPPSRPVFNGARDFVPDKLFVKGFCPYKQDAVHGLSQQQAAALFERLRACASSGLQRFIGNASHPFRRNRQITVYLKDMESRQQAIDLCKAWFDCVVSANLDKLGSFKLWFQLDAHESVKTRRRLLAQARAVVSENCELGDTYALAPDWAAGALFLEKKGGGGGELMLGSVDKSMNCVWCAASIATAWPSVQLATLTSAMNDE
jgi:hypothetical protein